MSRLARAFALVTMLAAMTVAGMAAVAQAQPTTDPATRQEAAVRRLLANERASIPSGAPAQAPSPERPAEHGGRPGWLASTLGALAVVLALVAVAAVTVARRTNRARRAGRTA
jgi:hypothetical protein